MNTDPAGIIIIGAGPVGLVTALGLARQGIPVTVLEAEPTLPRDLRAGSFHPPTVEMLAKLGLVERMMQIGIQVPRWQMRDRSLGLIAEFDLGRLREDTRFPFRLHCEQWKLAGIAYDALQQEPLAQVHLGAEVTDLRQDETGVDVVVRAAGAEHVLRGRFAVGADGARSVARRSQNIPFEGFTWAERFLVMSTTTDLAPFGFAPNAYVADPREWCAIFQMPDKGPPGLWRLAFPIDADTPDETVLELENCRQRLHDFLPEEGRYEVAYRSIYRVHQRVAEYFRTGRVVIAGDAAHVNNPLGGLGLNSGIHDADNLIDKLGAVWKGNADMALLDLYSRQRRQANIEYVQAMSIRNKRQLEEKDPAVRAERLQEIRDIAADPDRCYQHLLNTSMISSVRRAAAIT